MVPQSRKSRLSTIKLLSLLSMTILVFLLKRKSALLSITIFSRVCYRWLFIIDNYFPSLSRPWYSINSENFEKTRLGAKCEVTEWNTASSRSPGDSLRDVMTFRAKSNERQRVTTPRRIIGPSSSASQKHERTTPGNHFTVAKRKKLRHVRFLRALKLE